MGNTKNQLGSWNLETREQEKQDLVDKLRNNEQLTPEEANKLADLLESKDKVEKTEEEIKEEKKSTQELKQEHEATKNEQNDQVDALKGQLWEDTQLGSHPEKAPETITEADLLNKPNMTPEDKKNMQDVINFMKRESELRTDENRAKLYNNIEYTTDNHLKIDKLKRSKSYRKSTKLWPKNPEYIADKDDRYRPRAFYQSKTGLQYFNHEAALKEEKEMNKKGMKLPKDTDFEVTLQALPGNYKKETWYKGGNIFHLLFNGADKHTGYCDWDGSLNNETSDSYLWSSSEDNTNDARAFDCDDMTGSLSQEHSYFAFALRPLVQ